MARTTRSATNIQEKTDDDPEKTSSSPTSTKAKILPKKRKRNSGVDLDDIPNAKQAREDHEESEVKQEDDDRVEFPPLAGDQPIKEEDAQKILDVLEMYDNQGLLDRVFPLDQVLEATSPPTPSSSKTPSDSYSLRALLKEPSEHPLRVYRSAIKQLFPISSQPRSRISQPAAQQLKFCQLALSLIEEASKHTISCLSLRPEVVNPPPVPDDDKELVKEESSLGVKRRKYALVQRLPNGEWWTSLSLDAVGAEADTKTLKDLNTGHAELVSILPSPPAPLESTPTLGDLFPGKKPSTRVKPPGPRYVSAGTFLDYGPYASFAPTFDSEGADVGQVGLTSLLWRRHEKGKAREKARVLGERLRQKMAARASETMDVDGVEELDPVETRVIEPEKQRDKVRELLSGALAKEQVDAVTNLLDSLDLEENVNKLLLQNAKALLRLEELQKQRLSGEKGGSNSVEVGSEEWEIAQKIVNSLTLLASLRPRLSKDPSKSIIPPVSALRALHRTLPSQPAPGWYGTLADSRGSALRDDTTIYVKSPIAAPAAPAAVTPAPKAAVAPAPVVQTPAPAYPATTAYQQQNYAYTNYQQQYRAAYPAYGTGQQNTTGYYAGAAAPQAQITTPVQTAYSTYANGSQYPYAAWYSNFQTAIPPASATPARSTPQQASTTSAVTAAYAAYTPGAVAATPVRAVANTVAPKPQVNGWATPVNASYVAPTLPTHLRPATSTGSLPGTPSYGQSYVANYQATPSTSS